MDPHLNTVLNVALIVVILGGYLFYLAKAFPKKPE